MLYLIRHSQECFSEKWELEVILIYFRKLKTEPLKMCNRIPYFNNLGLI